MWLEQPFRTHNANFVHHILNALCFRFAAKTLMNHCAVLTVLGVEFEHLKPSIECGEGASNYLLRNPLKLMVSHSIPHISFAHIYLRLVSKGHAKIGYFAPPPPGRQNGIVFLSVLDRIFENASVFSIASLYSTNPPLPQISPSY